MATAYGYIRERRVIADFGGIVGAEAVGAAVGHETPLGTAWRIVRDYGPVVAVNGALALLKLNPQIGVPLGMALNVGAYLWSCRMGSAQFSLPGMAVAAAAGALSGALPWGLAKWGVGATTAVSVIERQVTWAAFLFNAEVSAAEAALQHGIAP